MVYSVNLTDLAADINPVAFCKYLEETGWRKIARKNTDIAVFQVKNHAQRLFQVTIPLSEVFSDYKEAMYMAVGVVADFELRNHKQILLSLLNPGSDILRVRVVGEGLEKGNIPFDNAIRVYENAKKLLTATAADLLRPQSYHVGSPRGKVLDFVSKCKFGQTEIGSYIVPVVCPPLSVENMQTDMFVNPTGEPFERRVTNRIILSLKTIKEHIDNQDLSGLINKQGADVISANFYEALSNFGIATVGSSVEFNVVWSPSYERRFKDESNVVEVDSNHYGAIKYIIDELKKETEFNTTIVGRIKTLKADADASEREDGSIEIVCINNINNEWRTGIVRVVLDKEDYMLAVEAHGKGANVKLVGRLKTSVSGAATIEEYESFEIIE